MSSPDPFDGWGLARLIREPNGPAEHAIRMLRHLSRDEAAAVRRHLDLMANVSAHALTEPLHKVTRDLYAYAKETVGESARLDPTETQVEVTILLDQFLNQIPLLRSRMLRNVRVFLGESVEVELADNFQSEFDTAGAWQTLWELRNSSQHAMLPTHVIRLGADIHDAGQLTRTWDLDVSQWRRLHSGFPAALAGLPVTLEFPQLVRDALALADQRMRQCFWLLVRSSMMLRWLY